MKLVLVILAMGVVTYLLRVIPLLALANRRLPQWLHRFLSGVPVAVLAAFAAPLIFAPEGALDISPVSYTHLVPVPLITLNYSSFSPLLESLYLLLVFCLLLLHMPFCIDLPVLLLKAFWGLPWCTGLQKPYRCV